MKGYLLDVNLLVALSWPSHVHHDAAHRWFKSHQAAGWATCPMTQCGLVRISSNPAIITDAVNPSEALALLRRIVVLPHHRFVPDDLNLLDGPVDLLLGHRQVTDTYLLGLAMKHRAKLATLDKSVTSLLADPKDRSKYIEWVSA